MAMDSYSESAHQVILKRRLESRDKGFIPFEVAAGAVIPRMFALQVARHPHRCAVTGDGISWTYQELNQASQAIAAAILRAGVDIRSPIALLVKSPANLVASILGALQAGGFYAPLDPLFPEDRNAQILRESQAKLILAERGTAELVERLRQPDQDVLYVDEVSPSGELPSVNINPSDRALIIFTSGSTGRPKGVAQTHENILRSVGRYTNSLCVGFLDRICLLSSCSVTASITTIFGSLLNGATLCALSVREEGLSRLADWLDAEEITVYRSVPSLFRNLMQCLPEDRVFPAIEVIRLGGDSLYRADWQLFTRHFSPGSVLVNFYGCSEMNTICCFYMDSASRLRNGVLPVGYPLADVELSVIDSRGLAHSVTLGDRPDDAPEVSGEIIIKSRYLSPGYWNSSTTEEAAFYAVDWEANGMRAYRTGDLGALRGNQGLSHLGRDDSQVKLSGFRVELAEVESCLRAAPGVRDAAAVVYTAAHGERDLIAFAVMNTGAGGERDKMRPYLEQRLPPHMTPSDVMVVDEIPQTPNGKIDRSALIRLREEAVTRKARSAPQTHTEQSLSEIWRGVLSLSEVGIDDDFFELGGNSILGMKLIARVTEKYDIQLRVLALLKNSTIKSMGQLVDQLVSARPG